MNVVGYKDGPSRKNNQNAYSFYMNVVGYKEEGEAYAILESDVLYERSGI